MAPANSPRSRGWTRNELARLLRVSPHKIDHFIKNGELRATNVASSLCGRPRWVILPDALAEFQARRASGQAPRPARRKKRTLLVDFYPD